MTKPIRRVYSFGDHTRSRPSDPVPGDMLDAQFDEIATTVDEFAGRVGTAITVDGKIAPGTVDIHSLEKGLLETIKGTTEAEIRPSLNYIQQQAIQAHHARIQAENAVIKAETSANLADVSAQRLTAAQQEAHQNLEAAIVRATKLMQLASKSQDHWTQMEKDAFAANETAKVWAYVSADWAEHMPDTIPVNTLQWMAISGEHWSARWWAHQAAAAAQAKVLVRGSSTRYLYFGFADGQTVFTGLDYHNQNLQINWTAHAAEVFVNGSLLTPEFDYATQTPNQLVLLQGVPKDTVVEIIVTAPFNTGLQALIETRKKLDVSSWVLDGVNVNFPLIDALDGSPITIGANLEHDVHISVNGTWQAAQRDYTVLVDRIQFTVPPESDAQIFGIAYDDPPDVTDIYALLFYQEPPAPQTQQHGAIWVDYSQRVFILKMPEGVWVEISQEAW